MVRTTSSNEHDATQINETAKMTNIEKGLYLLHSMRAVGQRQKTPFYPFQLVNSTGLPLRFATVSSIPSQVYASASTFPRHSQQLVKGNLRESEWRLVEPDQRVSFDCRINNKMRHKVINVLHELLLKVTLNKGRNAFNLSIKDKFCGPYRTMVIQLYLLKRTTSV